MKTPPAKPHSCVSHGHVWLEEDGTLYVRHRDRSGSVPVQCLYCDQTAELAAHGKATMPFPQEAQKAMATLLRAPKLRTKITAVRTAFASASVKTADRHQA